MSIADIYEQRAELAREEKELEQEALRTLQHRAFKHSIRLLFASIGFKIAEPVTDEDEQQDDGDFKVLA